MRHWIKVLGVVAALSMSSASIGQAQMAANDAIEDVIENQIEAFQADDFVRAFDFASPSIRNMFRTPENFGTMVQRGYPMVWRPAEVRMGELREIDGVPWQKVFVTDQAGTRHVLDYRMEQGADGIWRISAVQLLPSSELAV